MSNKSADKLIAEESSGNEAAPIDFDFEECGDSVILQCQSDMSTDVIEFVKQRRFEAKRAE